MAVVMTFLPSIALLAAVIVKDDVTHRSDSVQLPVYGGCAVYYEHYAHNSIPGEPKFAVNCSKFAVNCQLFCLVFCKLASLKSPNLQSICMFTA